MAIKEVGQSADSIIGIQVDQTAPTNTQVLAYNSTTKKWVSTAAASGGLTQEEVEDYVNGVIVGGTNITATYDDAAGTLTLAATDTNTQLTQEQVEDYVNGVIVGGTNITATYDDAAGTLTLAATDTNTQLTQEQVEDYVNGVIVGGTNITATYDDAAGTLTLVGADTNTQLTQEQVEDFVDGVIVAGSNITKTYDDAAGTLTLASADTNTQLTQEQVEDFVNGVCVGGTNVTITYDDGAGTLTFVAADTNTQLTQEQVEDFVDGVCVGGTNVTITYDDAAGTLTFVSADTNTQLTQEQVEDFVDGVIVGGTNVTATYDDAAGTLTLASVDTLSGWTDGANIVTLTTAADKVGVGQATPLVALDVLHDPTGLSGDTGGGESVKFGSGTTVAGKLYYLHTDGAWTLAQGDAVATGASQLLGLALGTAPGTHGMLIRGFFDVASHLTGTFVKGTAVYVSETTAGTIDVAAPAASGDFVRIVGHATDLANVIYFNPSGDWVEL